MSAITTEQIVFHGIDGHRIIGDARGRGNRVVLLVHGGGQTRHAWEKTAQRLADAGVLAVTVDQRGHGDSEWHRDGLYSFEEFAADLKAVALEIRDRYGMRPVVVGASLGGLAALLTEGESEDEILKALILVDVAPNMEQSGIDRVTGFMAARMREGFATVEEAADMVADYLPHRQRPKSLDGLMKNLRLHDDGRYRWHWDPRFLDGPHPISSHGPDMEDRLDAAARRLTVPTLLVRGGRSDLVTEAVARQFLERVPHAHYTDVSDAGHMVAGDRNDIFSDAVIDFLDKIEIL